MNSLNFNRTIAEADKEARIAEKAAISAIPELQARIAELEAENARLQAYEFASQQGHPNPCTLGPLCPYCEIERLKAELAALKEWRPIDTAPRDRSILLLQNGNIYTGRWSEHYKTWIEPGTPFQLNPTHWLPLPEVPNGGG